MKTKIMVIRNGGGKFKKRKWLYKGKNIEVVENFTYLDVNLKSNWNWLYHQEYVVSKAKNGLLTIKRLLYKANDFPVNWLFKIFDKVILPISRYGVEIWGGCMKKELLDTAGIELCRAVLEIKRGISKEGLL